MSNVNSANQSDYKSQVATFRASYRQLIDWARSRVIAEKSVDHLLAMAEFYGSLRWENFNGIYEDSDLQGIVQRKVLQSRYLRLPDLTRKQGGTVLIASALYESGGHSRVVLNLLKAFKEDAQHRLLITRHVASHYRDDLDKHGIVYQLCASRGIELINEILAYCAAADRIVLHIHPDDIIATTAVTILAASGKPIIFYNHADHVFSFGISSATVVCEVSNYGIELSKRTHRVKEYSYLGIPIDILGTTAASNTPTSKKQSQTVLSGGASYKYVPGKTSFSNLVDNVLERRDDVTFLLVGPTGKEPWWTAVRERWGNRIQFLGGLLTYRQYLDTLASSDVYVDSFPITGGTAFPEALLRKKLVTGLSNPIQGYSPADALRVADVQELSEEVIRLLDRDPASMRKVEQVRESAMAAHSMSSFRERVKNIYAGIYDKSAPSEVSIDTHWLERRWENGKSVSLSYSEDLWFRLPLRYCIGFKFKFSRLFGVEGHEDSLNLMRRIVVKPLPGLVRACLRHIRRQAHSIYLLTSFVKGGVKPGQ